jgi:small neutral amino acid transporter SnatA (MarC family)
MNDSFLSAVLLLLRVCDPFGSVPILISALRGIAPERSRVIAVERLLRGERAAVASLS